MESFSHYRKPLCDIDKKEILGYGYTSTIYRLSSPNSGVLKEIYLSDEPFETSKRFNELATNIFLTEELLTKQFIVPFHHFDFCESKLYMTFTYIPNTLYDTILQYSVSELQEIVKQVERAMFFINQTILHNDLTTRNVYIQKRKGLKVLIGDWGASQKVRFDRVEELSQTDSSDLSFFKQDLRRTISASLYLSSHSMKELFVKMKKRNIYHSFYQYYEKEQRYIKEKFSYRPKEFVKDLFDDAKTFEWQLIQYIYRTVGEKFFLEDIHLKKDMKQFLDSL